MPTVSDFRENLKKLTEQKVKSLTKAIVSDGIVETKLINLNRHDQIFLKGIDSNGRSLFEYSPATQGIYDRKPPVDTMGENKPFNSPYNLFWSGDSYYSFWAYVKGNKLFITSSQRGRRLLLMHGGPDIFGLTPENAMIANWEIIAPRLNEAIRKELL